MVLLTDTQKLQDEKAQHFSLKKSIKSNKSGPSSLPTRPALKMGITLPAFNSLDFISLNKNSLISDDELKEFYEHIQ